MPKSEPLKCLRRMASESLSRSLQHHAFSKLLAPLRRRRMSEHHPSQSQPFLICRLASACSLCSDRVAPHLANRAKPSWSRLLKGEARARQRVSASIEMLRPSACES